jgi:protein translocase SecG subunit
MEKFLIVIHFFACFLLIITVLFQGSKSSAMGIFGGGGSDALFSGATGTSFIKRFTIILALTIASTSVLLTVRSSKLVTTSVADSYQVQNTETKQ